MRRMGRIRRRRSCVFTDGLLLGLRGRSGFIYMNAK